MELVKPVEPVLWASIVELVIGGTGYGTVEALIWTGCMKLPFPFVRTLSRYVLTLTLF